VSNDNAIIRQAKRQLLQELRVASAARVDTFKREVGRIVANLMTRLVTTGLQPSDEQAVQQVPVLFPGGGGYTFAFDMRQGDPALLVCADGPVHGFWENGEAVTPTTDAGHNYGCAMAIPGGRISAEATPTDPPNAEGEGFIGAVDGSACVIFRGAGLSSESELGTVVIAAAGPTASLLLGSSDAAEPAACATPVLANLADLNTRIAAWAPVANDGGASLKAVFLAWANGLEDMADAKARFDGPAAP
jgi:hypothetical protein